MVPRGQKLGRCAGVIGTLACLGLGACDDAAKDVARTDFVDVAKGVSISGHVRYEGVPPNLPELPGSAAKDADCPHAQNEPDSRFEVSEEGGLAGVVLEVLTGSAAKDPDPIALDQKGCRYVPCVAAGQAGAVITVANSDPTFHNIRVVAHAEGSYAGGKNLSNAGQPPGAGPVVLDLTRPGIYRLECDIHRWMRSFVYLSRGIFVCVSDQTGAFSFPRKLQDGVYRVKAWHPLAKHSLEADCQVTNGVGTLNVEFRPSDLLF